MYRVELKEAKPDKIIAAFLNMFLMYRVELKDGIVFSLSRAEAIVPNVPCGVERPIKDYSSSSWLTFLMYRVELKVYQLR